MEDYNVIVTSYAENDFFVAEIWFQNRLIAILNQDNERMINDNVDKSVFKNQEYLLALDKARKKLNIPYPTFVRQVLRSEAVAAPQKAQGAKLTGSFEVVVISPYYTDEFQAEIWYENRLIAILHENNDKFIDDNIDKSISESSEFLSALDLAIKKLYIA